MLFTVEGLESFATGFAIARSAFSHGQWRNRIGGKNHAMFTFCWQMSEQSSILLWARDETRSRHYDTATPSGGRGPRHQIDSLCTRLPVEKTCRARWRQRSPKRSKGAEPFAPQERRKFVVGHSFPIARFLEVWFYSPPLVFRAFASETRNAAKACRAP